MLAVLSAPASTKLTTVEAVREEFPSITTAVASDAQVGRWIERASAMAVKYCGREFAQATVRQAEYPCGVSQIVLDRTPATDLVVTHNGETLEATDFHHDTQRGVLRRLSGGRPSVWAGEVIIEYKGGYVTPDQENPTLPGDVEYAVLLWLATFVASQASATSTTSGGLKREQIDGVGVFEYYQESTSSSSSSTTSADRPTPESLLQPFRRVAL